MGIRVLALSFARSQRAAYRAPLTIRLYAVCIERLVVFRESTTGSDDLSGVSSRLLRDFYGMRAETVAPSTLSIDYRVHHVFFRWLVDEGEISTSPMDRVRSPKVPARPVPVLTNTDLRALVAACKGASFRDRRDTAFLRLPIVCGLRRTELASLRVTDLDMEQALVTVTGKGKTRVVAFGATTTVALDGSLRRRSQHRLASSPALWLGLTPSGLYQALRERAESAGVTGWHTHRVRHTFSHQWLLAGGNESDLMQVAGMDERRDATALRGFCGL